MKVLVIGSEGQLGTDVCEAFADAELFRADIETGDIAIDIANPSEVARVIGEELRPDTVINTAAFHNVPKCEEEPATAFAVNATAVQTLAKECQKLGSRLVHISTDYVYGNGGQRPYKESDLAKPLSIYGASKLAGECLGAAECSDFIVVRSSGLYGAAPCRAKGGNNFVDLMLRLAAERGEVNVVTDERVSPTYTAPLARQIRAIVEKGSAGLYHATCAGECTWYEFAKAIFEETGTEAALREATQADFPSTVRRPDYSVLQNVFLEEQGIDAMPHWREALKEYLSATSRGLKPNR